MPKDYHVPSKIDERNRTGKAAEADGDVDNAIKAYEENVKEAYPDEFAYNRLLIIYRKQKRFKEELRILNRGIKIFSEQLSRPVKSLKNKKQITDLSNAFMLKSGLRDRKGNHTYFPEPVNKWMKRKTLVEQKIAKK